MLVSFPFVTMCLPKKYFFGMFARMRARRGQIDDGDAGRAGPFRENAESSPRRLMEERRRNRVLRGALDVFGEKGFASATVQDLIDAAGTSRATFYKDFPDREACLEALSDAVLSWLESEAREAIGTAGDWPSQVRSVTERLVRLLIDDPRLARVCGIEATPVSVEIRTRQRVAFEALAAGLRRGRPLSRWGEDLPAALEDLLVAGGISFVERSVFWDRPPAKALAPEITELILIPYLGGTRAKKLVRGA
jgi:AcrR family transcriptional regulator